MAGCWQPLNSSYRGCNPRFPPTLVRGGGWSLYLLLETLGQFHVPSMQGAGAVVVRAQT